MSARHRHAKARQRELALLGTSAADVLGPNLVIVSALCAAFALGMESWTRRDRPAIAIGDTVRVVWVDSPWYSAIGKVTGCDKTINESCAVTLDTKTSPVVMFRPQDLKRQ